MNKAAPVTTEELFDSIAQFIDESRALIDADKLLELGGLDDHIHTLCTAVLQLSQDERLKYADRLQQLLGDLKALGDSMIARRDVIAGEIQHVSHHKKATTAYRTAKVGNPIAEKDED